MVSIKDLVNMEFHRAATRPGLHIDADTVSRVALPVGRMLAALKASREIYDYRVVSDGSVNPPGIWLRDDCVVYACWTRCVASSLVYESWMTLDTASALERYAEALRQLEPGPNCYLRLSQSLSQERQLIDVRPICVSYLSQDVEVDDVLVGVIHKHRSLADYHPKSQSIYVISRDYGVDAERHYRSMGCELHIDYKNTK